jgi:hypothetical protein
MAFKKEDLTVTVEAVQFHERKMTDEQLQEYIKMKKSGSGRTKNKKKLSKRVRGQKHKKQLY